jgi:hypothetical protein
MGFVVSAQTLAQAWAEAQGIAVSIENIAQSQINASLAGPVVGSQILNFDATLRVYRTRLDAIAAMPGIAAYVTALANTPQGYDVSAQFAAMRAQIVGTSNWIQANFPRDSTNTYMLERSWGADGPVERSFSTTDLASYRTQLNALIASIG